jgi:Tol biopolymer transport system component
MQEADIETDSSGKPSLANQRVILESKSLPFKCTLETQNFIPPDEKQITFSAYGYQGTEVMKMDLEGKKIDNCSLAPDQYDEPEGIFPDGRSTLVECDRQNHQGSGHVDLWRLQLDGNPEHTERLTFFSDTPGYKASNPVVSDDGKFIAFQMAMARDAAGVGHGLFIYDFDKAKASSTSKP